MNRLILFIQIFVLLSCTSSNHLPNNYPRIPTLLLSDVEEQKSLQAQLGKKSIPYIIDGDFLIYSLANQAEVLSLIREVKYKGTISEEVIEYMVTNSEAQKVLLLKEFNEQNIDFQQKSFDAKNGYFLIQWNQLYGRDVDIIRQDVNTILSKSIKSGS